MGFRSSGGKTYGWDKLGGIFEGVSAIDPAAAAYRWGTGTPEIEASATDFVGGGGNVEVLGLEGSGMGLTCVAGPFWAVMGGFAATTSQKSKLEYKNQIKL